MASFWKNSLFGGAVSGIQKMFSGGLDPQKISSLDPTQQELYGQSAQALQGGGGPLADIYGFDPQKTRDMWQQQYAEPAYQEFQEGIVPGITGQFRGQNLQNSSYLGGALGKAGTDVQKGLDTQLAGMLYQGQEAALGRKQTGLNQLLGMQTFAYQQSPLMQLLSSLAGGAGKAAGTAVGGLF